MLNHTTPPQDWQGGLNFDYRIQMKPNDTRYVLKRESSLMCFIAVLLTIKAIFSKFAKIYEDLNKFYELRIQQIMKWNQL